MAKKKRNLPDRSSGNTGGSRPDFGAGAATWTTAPATPMGGAIPTTARYKPGASAMTLPAEITRGDWTALILALVIFFAPAVGVPHEEMLQDTLKSIVVSFGALGAALLFFWQQRNRRDGLRWIPQVNGEISIPVVSIHTLGDLFVPFVTGDARGRGAGLGLAICKELAQACGGRLQVANRVDQGRVLGLDATLWLPPAADKPERPSG